MKDYQSIPTAALGHLSRVEVQLYTVYENDLLQQSAF